MIAGVRPPVDVVVVDFNAGVLVSRCVASVLAQFDAEGIDGRVIVVDNASREPTRDVVGSDDDRIVFVRNERNRGFAAACNQGARRGDAPYVLFLNPDTELHPGSLAAPLAFLEAPANAQVGIVGIQLVDERGAVSITCSEFPRVRHFVHHALGLDRLSPARFPGGAMASWNHRQTREVDQVMGAFFLVRRALFDRLDGFDERFFVYFEEVDFAARAREAGFASVFLADARATHAGCGTTEAVRAFRLFLSLESRIRYGLKHFSRTQAAALLGVTLVVEPLSRLGVAVARRSWRDVAEVAGGYRRLYRALPRVIRRPAGAGLPAWRNP